MKTFRSKVFKMAHELMRATGELFAVCLSRAWNMYRLTKYTVLLHIYTISLYICI